MFRPIIICIGRILFFFKNHHQPNNPRAILVMKMGGIGDLLMVTPFLRRLRHQYPQAKIVVVCSQWGHQVLSNNPHLDQLITVDDSLVWQGGAWGWWGVIKQLRSQRFDLGFVLDKHWKGAVFAWATGTRFRVGFDRHGEGFANNRYVPFALPRHEVEYQLALLGVDHPTQADMAMEVFPSPPDENMAADYLRQQKWVDVPLVGLTVGGAQNPGQQAWLKRWPLEHYRKTIQRLMVTYPRVNFIIFGGPSDKEIHQQLLLGLDRQRIGEISGQLPLMATLCLIAHCRLFVTHDTGPMHMAAAAGTPVIAIFGPTDPRRYQPIGQQHTVLFRGDQAGALCYTIFGSFPQTTHDLPCMIAITPDNVIDIISHQYRKHLE